jgi:hypothetical protein
MSRYKDLIFSINRNALKNDILSKAFLIKVYNTYQIRNEWYNWSSNTKSFREIRRSFSLDLSAIRDSCEYARTRGTVFGIDEYPALYIIGNKYILIISELFSDLPFSYIELADIDKSLSLMEIDKNIRIDKSRAIVSAMYTGNTENILEVRNNEIYYSHKSVSSGSKNSLTWNMKPRNINCDKMFQLLNKFDIQIAK